MATRPTIKWLLYTTFAVCLALMSFAVLITKDASQAYQLARVDHSDMVRQSYRLIEDHEWMREHHDRYRHLTKNGLIGTTDRIVWMDLLAPLHQRFMIEDFRFEISAPDVQLQGDVTVQTLDVDIYGTLRHDGVLADLLKELSVNAPGGWYFQSMEVVRSEFNQLQNEAEQESHGLSMVLLLKSVSIVTPNFPSESAGESA